MRISVCEFLRLSTQRNWFYLNPGHWMSDRGELQAIRTDLKKPDTLQLYRGKRVIKTLEYFVGQNSLEVRFEYKKKFKKR